MNLVNPCTVTSGCGLFFIRMNEPDRMETLTMQGKMDIPAEVADNKEIYCIGYQIRNCAFNIELTNQPTNLSPTNSPTD